MTLKEYDKKINALKEAKKYVTLIKHCNSLDSYKNQRELTITMGVGTEGDFYSWRTWTLNNYDEDLLLDVMSAIKKYQARLTKRLEEIE